MSIGSFFLFARFLAPEIGNEPGNVSSDRLIVLLTAVGASLVIVSFVVKRKILERSVERQDVGLVLTGSVIAWAICEGSALLGLLERFLIGNGEYYLLFLLAAAGTAFHFPQREHLLAASYKTSLDRAAS